MNSAREYELFVKLFFEDRLRRELGYDVPILHQAKLHGKNNEQYIVDLYYVLLIAGIKILTIIECKYWTRRVQRRNVNDFRSQLDDLGANKGIIVSRAGFDEGAIRVAEASGIGLFKLTNEEFQIFLNWTGTKDNIKSAYEDLASDELAVESGSVFSGLFFPANTSIWGFLTHKYGKEFAKYLVHFCFHGHETLDSSSFEMPDDIRKILSTIDLAELTKEYRLFETAGLNYKLSTDEEVKAIFNAIVILQFQD
jgi:hypothetical protein